MAVDVAVLPYNDLFAALSVNGNGYDVGLWYTCSASFQNITIPHHNSSRHKNSCLLAELLGGALLKVVHSGVLAVHVVADL